MESSFTGAGMPFAAAAPEVAGPSHRKVREHGGRFHGRRERRTPHRVPCRVRVYDVPRGKVTSLCGKTVNISAGGLAVQLAEDIAPGTWVEALVPRPGTEPMSVTGTVVHSRRALADQFEIGIGLDNGTRPPPLPI